MVHVDLATRIIPDNRIVVVARPGAQYRLAGAFIEGRVVGPDLPNLEWAADDPAHIQIAKIKRSIAYRNWYGRGRPADDPPRDDLDAYDGYTTTDSVRQLLRVVRYYFETAQRGDLVVIPPESLASDAQIGEFVSPPARIVTYTVPRYEPASLVGRRVQWLGSIPKKALPGITLEALRKPAALIQLPKSFLPRVYQEAYGSYAEGGRYVTQFDVSADKYTISDDINALGFFKFVAYNFRQIDTREDGTPEIALRSIEEAAFRDVGDYAPDLSTEISSPGFLTLASPHLVPLVASALFALAVHVGPAAHAQAEAGTLTIGNSAAPADDPCALRVQEHIYDYMVLLGAEKWARACEIAREAANNNGLKSQAIVE